MIGLGTSSAWAWKFVPDKDALRQKASSYASNKKGVGTPHLMVVCNNYTRVTYVEWPSDFGFDVEEAPVYVLVTLNIDDLPADAGNIWLVGHPEPGITTLISHRAQLPRLLAGHNQIEVRAQDPANKIKVSAKFSLSGLFEAMLGNRMPCEPPKPLAYPGPNPNDEEASKRFRELIGPDN